LICFVTIFMREFYPSLHRSNTLRYPSLDPSFFEKMGGNKELDC
jgi:hypothetical protein